MDVRRGVVDPAARSLETDTPHRQHRQRIIAVSGKEPISDTPARNTAGNQPSGNLRFMTQRHTAKT